jgi:hypothetical protein
VLLAMVEVEQLKEVAQLHRWQGLLLQPPQVPQQALLELLGFLLLEPPVLHLPALAS